VLPAPFEEKSTATTIPFFKKYEFDYAEVLAWTGKDMKNGPG
jgi:phospho-N-acetylmuramoyl-pentapeptide-transferase